MRDKIDWMAQVAAEDGMRLDAEDIALIIAHGGNAPYEQAELDYVMELEKEWMGA